MRIKLWFKGNFKYYLLLILTLIILMISPVFIREGLQSGLAYLFSFGKGVRVESENNLQIENLQLKAQVDYLQSLLQQEKSVNQEVLEFLESDLNYEKDSENLQNLFKATPARIIFRSPALWNNSFWIYAGEDKNILKNSPVIVGLSVVGVVEYVGKRHSRVRLITDPNMQLSVRAVREEDGKKYFLGKGILRGSGFLSGRIHSSRLLGEGFNYDFEDEKGPARILQTGDPINDRGSSKKIVEIDDLLITSGMDGIFPEGLKVAKVNKIEKLKEGAFSYFLEAKPVADNINDLKEVFVLPSIRFSY